MTAVVLSVIGIVLVTVGTVLTLYLAVFGKSYTEVRESIKKAEGNKHYSLQERTSFYLKFKKHVAKISKELSAAGLVMIVVGGIFQVVAAVL